MLPLTVGAATSLSFCTWRFILCCTYLHIFPCPPPAVVSPSNADSLIVGKQCSQMLYYVGVKRVDCFADDSASLCAALLGGDAPLPYPIPVDMLKQSVTKHSPLGCLLPLLPVIAQRLLSHGECAGLVCPGNPSSSLVMHLSCVINRDPHGCRGEAGLHGMIDGIIR